MTAPENNQIVLLSQSSTFSLTHCTFFFIHLSEDKLFYEVFYLFSLFLLCVIY